MDFAQKFGWLVLAGVAVLIPLSAVSAKSFKSITPLKTTRSEVEKLFGKPDTHGNYLIDGKTVKVWYVDTWYLTPCDDKEDCECNVPKDTVREIDVHFPEDEVVLETFNLDLTQFKKTRSQHLTDYVTYSDYVNGIVYTVVNADGKDKINLVAKITYLPSEQDCQSLTSKQK
jgi:hypothetical protein